MKIASSTGLTILFSLVLVFTFSGCGKPVPEKETGIESKPVIEPEKETAGEPEKQAAAKAEKQPKVPEMSATPAAAVVAARDALFTVSGDEYKGELLDISGTEVVFRHADAKEVKRYSKSEVQRIELQQRRRYDKITNAAQVTDPVLRGAIDKPVAPSKYPKSNIAIVHRNIDVTWYGPGRGEMLGRNVFQVLDKGGERYGKGSVYYFKDTENLEFIYALTVPSGGRVLHLSDDSLKSEAVHGEIPRYNRLYRLRYALKEVKVGSVVDIMTRREIRPHNPWMKTDGDPLEPLVLDEYFRGRQPLLSKTVNLRFPKSMEKRVIWRLVRGDGIVEHKVREDGKWQVHSWRLKAPADPILPEPAMPPTGDIAPRLVAVFLPEWPDNPSDTDQLLSAINNKTEYAELLSKKASEIKAAAGGDRGKLVRLAYDFVSAKITHAGPAPAGFRLTPFPAGLTLKEHNGNILDKCNLLYALLTECGVRSKLLLAHDTDDPKLVEGVPALSFYDLPCVSVEMPGDRKVFLYPSDYRRGFGELPERLQGAEATVTGLGIHDENDRFSVHPVIPERPLENEGVFRDVEMNISPDGSATVNEKLAARGETAGGLRGLADLSKPDLDNYVSNIVSSKFNGAVLLSYETSELKKNNPEEYLRLKWRAEGYCIRAGDKVLSLKLPGVSWNTSVVSKSVDDREWPMRFTGRDFSRTIIRIRLPEGYRVYHRPPEFERRLDGLIFMANVVEDAETLVFTIEWIRTTKDLPLERYAEVKAQREAMALWAKQWIVLEKK